MSEVLARLREAAPAAFDGEPIAFAYVFGSHATGTATARSDLDVAVHLRPGTQLDHLSLRLRLARAVEEQLGAGPVDVVVLDDAPLSVAGRIHETGMVIYSVDEVLRVRHASRISRMYHDFKIHEERTARERLAHMANGR